jgi:hypothetical protein
VNAGLTLIAALIIAAAPLAAQSDSLVVRVWQFEPDGSRFSTGRRVVPARGDVEIRLMVGDPSASAFWQRLRLDATLSLHDTRDSTLVGGTVAAGRVTDVQSAGIRGESQVTIEERRYALRLAVPRGESLWFFPFGQPSAGERGLGFELTRGDSGPPLDRRWSPRTRTLLIASDLSVVARPAPPQRIRLEVGQPGAFAVAYEGPIHSLSPVEIPVPNAPRGSRLAFSTRPRPWFTDSSERCWHWKWADGQPPAGSTCRLTETKPWLTLLFGSRGQLLRVTALGG